MPAAPVVVNGQVNVLPTRQVMAGLGNYYVATNPTPGTGVTYALVTSFSATADGLFTVANNNPSGGRTIQLDYLHLMMTTATAATGTTVQKMAVYVEQGIVAPSAGNVAVVPRPVNPSSPQTGAIINGFSAGAATIPAAVGIRTLVSNGSLATSLGIASDSYVYIFGGNPSISSPALIAARATAPARLVTTMAPVTIPPQTTAIIDFWWLTAAANAPVFEYELGYFES